MRAPYPTNQAVAIQNQIQNACSRTNACAQASAFLIFAPLPFHVLI